MIKAIKDTYVQKSRMFCYPLLNIRRGNSITPIETYLSWKGQIDFTDCKFITVYHLRDDAEFKMFEEKKLLGNPLFEDFMELEDGTGAYVFDFNFYKTDFQKIVKGKYSMLCNEYKSNILKFYTNHKIVESYLHPDKYFNDYAKLLNVSVELLKQVGELCSLPNLNKETLPIPKKVFNFDDVNKM